VAAALAFFYLRFAPLPGYFLIPLKGSAVALLSAYAFLRHSSPDAKMLGWALAAASLGDMAMELDRTIGGLFFLLFHAFTIGLFLRHRRSQLAPTQSWVVGLTLVFTPIVAWLLPVDREAAWQVGLYGAALGGMAAAAWASTFPRYRVGAGAMLFLVSDLLIFAEMGPLDEHFLPRYMVWPLYYLGVLLITTGVIETLRKREPDLRLVSNR
jgi:uncharacterized membrane protein YhhN